MRYKILIFPFYRWSNQDIENMCHMRNVTQLKMQSSHLNLGSLSAVSILLTLPLSLPLQGIYNQLQLHSRVYSICDFCLNLRFLFWLFLTQLFFYYLCLFVICPSLFFCGSKLYLFQSSVVLLFFYFLFSLLWINLSIADLDIIIGCLL